MWTERKKALTVCLLATNRSDVSTNIRYCSNSRR